MGRHRPRHSVTTAAAHHSLKAHTLRNLETELARVARSAFFVASFHRNATALAIAKNCRNASRNIARQRRELMKGKIDGQA